MNSLLCHVKGSVSQGFQYQFLSWFEPIGPWSCQDNRMFKKLCVVHSNAVSELKILLVSAWVLLKEQSGKLIIWMNTSITGETIWSVKGSQSLKFLPIGSCSPLESEFYKLYDRIYRRNLNHIRKYFSLLIKGLDGIES